MTSPSPRNLRTTASSTLPRTRSSSVWSLLAACAVAAGGLLAAPAAAEDSPLERLQQRSGDARWDELRARAHTGPAALKPNAPGAGLFHSANELPIDDESAPPAPAEAAPPAPEDDEPVAGSPINASGNRATARPFELEPMNADPEFIPRQQFPIASDPRPAPTAGTVFLEADAPPAPGAFDDLQSPTPLRAKPLLLRPITDIQPFFDYSPTGGDPCEHLCPAPQGVCPDDPNRLCPEPLAMPMGRSADRYFPHLEYYWAASNLYHNPLYFENPALERYGHVHIHDCVEPVYSMARFSAQLVGLPYQMALDHACRRQYALGWYRPGDFAPKLVYQPPLNARAAGTAAAVYTGLFLLVP